MGGQGEDEGSRGELWPVWLWLAEPGAGKELLTLVLVNRTRTCSDKRVSFLSLLTPSKHVRLTSVKQPTDRTVPNLTVIKGHN